MSKSGAKDPLRLLEAAYSFVPSEEVWLNGVLEALAPYDLGSGIAAYVSLLGEDVSVRSVASAGTEMDAAAVVHQMAAFLPPTFYRRIHAPTPLVSNLESFPAAAKSMRDRIRPRRRLFPRLVRPGRSREETPTSRPLS
jgi:hypothetical protein